MESNKYEHIKFNSWQDLAKYVIDGGEVYFKAFQNKYLKVTFNGTQFDTNIEVLYKDRELFTKKQPTLEELIAIKSRLCWVWNHDDDIRDIVPIYSFDGSYYSSKRWRWNNAQMLTDDEIKQFLSGE